MSAPADRRWRIAAIAGVILVFVLTALAEQTAVSAGASTEVRAPEGLRALYTYLDARELEPIRWERPLHELGEGAPGTLVLAGPWRDGWLTAELETLHNLRTTGWSILLLFSGDEPSPGELAVLDRLGLTAGRRARPPLLPWAWRAWHMEAEPLTPTAEFPGQPVVRRSAYTVVPPAGHHTLYESADGVPMVFQTEDRAVLVVNNGSLFANGWLGEAGNLAAAEALLTQASAGRVVFDEWHHGHRALLPGEEPPVLTPVSALIGHAFLLYLFAAWALSRPFGRRARGAAASPGSASRDLLALASLHRAGGHAPGAGRRLLELARAALARRRHQDPEALDALPERFDGGPRELVALARTVGELQRDHKL